MLHFYSGSARQGTNISHLGKRKIIFIYALGGDMLVPQKVYIYIYIQHLHSLDFFRNGSVRLLVSDLCLSSVYIGGWSTGLKNSVDFFFGSSLCALLVAFSHGFGSSPEQGEILAFAKGYTWVQALFWKNRRCPKRTSLSFEVELRFPMIGGLMTY